MRRPSWEPDFIEFYHARSLSLRRTAYAMCGDWTLADDLVQHTFTRLYSHWPRIQGDRPDGYARRTLVNQLLNGRRTSRRETLTDEVPTGETTTAAVEASRTEDRLDLLDAIRELPPRQRAIIALRFLDDLSVAETAEILGMAEGTVKSQTARAIAGLRGRLDATADRHH
jgi:RNA polymerase sigma-70 factor (sigma-E family)